MVLIISHNSLEYSTEDVMDWIQCLGHEAVRINGKDLVSGLGMSMNIGCSSDEVQLRLPFNSSDITAVWNRRWMDFQYFDEVPVQGATTLYSEEVNSYLKLEFRSLSKYFFAALSNKKTLGNFFYDGRDPSKVQQLLIAKNAGLSVPDTLITDNKTDLGIFLGNHIKIITKSIGEIRSFHFENFTFGTFTSIFDTNLFADLPDTFYPTLFQEAIEKEIEIRVFYLSRECYSMAIFSNLDPQTSMDFRRYNTQKPNRYVPFKLPPDIEERIRTFMTLVNLETGSLDFILSTEGRYVFLEVNPSGQFGMVSDPCNYYLEKEIAKYLINQS